MTSGFSGTAETFLFTFKHSFTRFNSSGLNNYFVKALPDCLVIGGFEPAIWLDHNLERGTSGVSNTFDNTPLTEQQFCVKDMECWALDESVASHVGTHDPSHRHNRSHDSNHSQEICNPAYLAWRRMEECRQYSQQFKFDDMNGSPYIDREALYLKQKVFEDESVGENKKVRFRMGEDLIRKQSLSNLTAPSAMSQDWTRSLYC